MDFLDPKKKRAHKIRLFVGYGLMAVVLTLGTVIIVLQAYGFDIDRKTGEVIQNGLVFVDAHPEAADVKIDGVEKGRTDQRYALPSGRYTLELSRPGYRNWRRSFDLQGGSIERFVYPYLFPEQLLQETLTTYTVAPRLTTVSPDRRWMLVQHEANPSSFLLYDLNDKEDLQSAFATPQGVFTVEGDVHSLSLVEWSTDNRRVLVQHTHQAGTEFILLDREDPAASINLTKTFSGTPFTAVSLKDKKFDKYYLYDQTTKTLLEAELNGQPTSTLLTNVLGYRSHGDDVLLYATTEGATDGKVLIKIQEDNKTYILREQQIEATYALDLARFNGKWYMTTTSTSEKRAYVYADPIKALERDPNLRPTPSSVLKLDQDPQFVSFSANARFIALQGGSEFAVYDAETDRTYRYDTKLVLSTPQKAQWMDGHRLTLVSENIATVFDFDGINQQKLSGCMTSAQLFFDRDYNAMYCVASDDSPSIFLKRTDLFLGDNDE